MLLKNGITELKTRMNFYFNLSFYCINEYAQSTLIYWKDDVYILYLIFINFCLLYSENYIENGFKLKL